MIKKDGSISDNIEALVETGKVFIEDTSVSIEEEDIIIRTLPNGNEERLVVLDRGFYRGMHGIPDNYQVKVEKESKYKSSLNSSTGQTYNINNQSGKINIHSTDQSINYTLTAKDEQLFKTLKDLARSIDDRGQLEVTIDELRDNIGKETYAEKYNKFIQSAANHMTVFAPFIPMLSKFLLK
ncbi:hypothetical protein GCM10012290_25690 [Halolactibacillus alkaliphilus]|uniref:hypothetical protein n=1 Tax=Halolactibacillus alkaliphilus TaxID=442899 RepID=UPI0008E2BD60|nr:hypothetical protein [Halolactibacillus alkaliphilus]GGN76200.1 hypothetical protein GCM10012290_25690 [Halolactibacillus alkaliphilus]SFP11310.1 hypothetical protein SAMN05720591_1513 [Halolactibacillus alkaliphilus]